MAPIVRATMAQKVSTLVGGIFLGVGAVLLTLGVVLGLGASIVVLAVLGGIGLVFVVVGATLALVARSMVWRAQRLLDGGQRVEGEIIGVDLNTEVMVNGRYPWRIRCLAYPPYSETPVQVFSPDWQDDPTPLLERLNVKSLPVYVNPDHPGAGYYVDDSSVRSDWPRART